MTVDIQNETTPFVPFHLCLFRNPPPRKRKKEGGCPFGFALPPNKKGALTPKATRILVTLQWVVGIGGFGISPGSR